MSRSKRKTPIRGVTTAPSDKPFKLAEHRRERTQVKARLRTLADDTALPSPKLYGEPWDGLKDGKMYLGREASGKDLRK